MNNPKRQINDSEIDALLSAYFSDMRSLVTPPLCTIDDIIEKGSVGEHEHSVRSPYVVSTFTFYAAQRFALTFASLLIVVGVAAGSLETNAFSGNMSKIHERIPIMREALSMQIDEILSQREHTTDDADFGAPESEADPFLKNLDVYGETHT